MTSKADKLLVKLRNTRRGFSEGDLFTILTSRGFRSREGNHTVYEHEQYPELTLTIPVGKELPPVYAQRVLRMIEALDQLEEE